MKVRVDRGRRYPRFGRSAGFQMRSRFGLLYSINPDRLRVAWCRRCIEE